MKITLKEIAKEAGVSQATISRIVNGNAVVSSSLEQKVFTAARNLGVEIPRKKILREPPKVRPSVIGLLVVDLANPYFQEVMRGVVGEAKQIDYGVQIYETKEDLQLEEEAFYSIANFHLDGMILCGIRMPDTKLLSFYHKADIPMVLVNRYIKDSTICCITVDHRKSMFQATTHLIDLGHKRIAFLSGPSKSNNSLNRRSGIVDALANAGLKLDPDLCLGSFPDVDGGFQSMISLLSLPKEKQPSAVIAYNDLVAIGALRAIRMKSLRVPEDISIIGMDNIPITAHTYPPLTTVSPPKIQIGALAVRNIHRMNTGEYENREGYMEVEAPLTLRYSTGPAPASNIGTGPVS